MRVLKIAIHLGYEISEIKAKYRLFFGLSPKVPVKRLDVVNWLSAMVQTELDRIKKSPKS